MKNNTSKTTERIVINGAGLTGSLLALFLGQQGIKVSVYDKRGDIRQYVPTKKRSLGMSLSTRGRLALDKAGILDKLIPSTVAQSGRATHSLNGDVKFQIYGDGSQSLSTVNRKIINDLLINSALETGMVDFYFHHKLVSMDLEQKKLDFKHQESGESVEVTYDYVFGADGANSRLGELLKVKNEIERERTVVNHYFKEMSIPTNAEGDFAFDPAYVHIWSSDDLVFVALPNVDKTFISTMFYKNNEEGYLVNISAQEDLEKYFATYFPYLLKSVPQMVQDFIKNPASNITQVNCTKWNYRDEVLLIGDSAHAFAPFYAMGMNTCFEDCQIFIEKLMENDFDFGKTISDFAVGRKKDVDAMQFLTNRHYHNLQYSKNTSFDIKWKLERKLWNLYPDLLVPEYYEVAFSQTPFSQIVETSHRNKEIIEEVYVLYMALLNENKNLHIDEFANMKEVREILIMELMETSTYSN